MANIPSQNRPFPIRLFGVTSGPIFQGESIYEVKTLISTQGHVIYLLLPNIDTNQPPLI